MPFTSEERNELLTRYWESVRQTTYPNDEKLTENQLQREYAKQENLLDTYRESLPMVPVSRCPFCSKVLEYTFDPWGLDGMWWGGEVSEVVPNEPHFRVLQGGIDFHGRQPTEADPNDSVLPGPGVPFVVTRLVAELGLTAVISTFSLPHGDTAYIVGYYSEQSVDPYQLHQPWARESFAVYDDDGAFLTWGAVDDAWDFELQPWIDKGLVRWIDPGDETLTIRDSGNCPYVGLPGSRTRQVIQGGQLSELPLPDDEPFDPFDSFEP